MRVICSTCGGPHPSWQCKRPAQKSAPVAVEEPDGLAAGVIVSADPKEVKRKRPKSAIVALPSGKLEHTMIAPEPVNQKLLDEHPDYVARLEAETKKPGRPRIHDDRKAYKAQKQREYRAKRAAAKEAKL